MTSSSQPTPLSSPAIQSNSWRFGDLAAADLLPLLQQHLLLQDADANWQLVWLNNNEQPVIGLLPKVSWQVHANKPCAKKEDDQSKTYQVVRHYRGACTSNDATVRSNVSYHAWQDELIAYSNDYENSDTDLELIENNDKSYSYSHGLIGFIGYDIAAHSLSPAAGIEQAAQPCAVFGHYDIYLSAERSIVDENQKQWTLQINSFENEVLLDKLVDYLTLLDVKLSTENSRRSLAPLRLQAKWQRSDYQQAFKQTQHYLHHGDCYQINLTQRWQGQVDTNTNTNTGTGTGTDNKSATPLLDYLPVLHHNTQTPFAGYMSISRTSKNEDLDAHFELLSCSPELFFTFIRDSKNDTYHIRTKPIKGTIPRGANVKQDEAFKQQLIDSDKDRSENVMIVDLLRNDLGKYARTGSVKVPQLFDIESFSNVHHMVSTITAELKPDTHPLSVLFGSLPAGSITGTPKKRAVEIISELENAPRGAYCGTMGYMNFDGSGQWNVLIRTLQAVTLKNNSTQVSLWAGGGITVVSDCASEYQECLDKVGNLLAVLAQD